MASMNPAPVPPPTPAADTEIRIVSHSNLFYWWPVWAVGFLMAILTFLDGHRLLVVPEHTLGLEKQQVEIDGKPVVRNVFALPEGKGFDPGDPREPKVHTAQTKTYGVLFTIVLLLVITITNVPLRGLWSVVVIVFIILGSIILSLLHWWEPIFDALGHLAIHINAAGYLFISLGLFVVWLLTFQFFDQQMYMVFSPGQLKVCLEIGGGEKAYDTAGMTIEKQRSDLFRHWILGLGSGDLIVNTVGAHVQHFDLPNVLFIGRKVEQIEKMLREKAVVRGR